MAMSKKDFIALADMISASRAHNPNTFRMGEILELAEFCRSQNPRFMRDRWLDYIAGKYGKNGGKVAA